MVKAAEGGGGIGIHIVESMDELLPLIERTRQVADHAFGSAKLYFERCLKNASHIEVQVIGDSHGNLLHLFERDCSVQRRNQKLVEETQAEKLSPEVRSKVCRLALKLGRKIGYTNAGTVEFLVSKEGLVFFLEMNTRLQVEHGVTELLTGVDLVELQIRVAAGEPLPLTQKDIKPKGHAIEVRVYPEDPDTFLPGVGTVTQLNLPSPDTARVDSALFEGYQVALEYEPLLAKVMAWGETREESVKRLLRALLAFRLEGVKCNIPLPAGHLGRQGICRQHLPHRIPSSMDGRAEAAQPSSPGQRSRRRQRPQKIRPGNSCCHRRGAGNGNARQSTAGFQVSGSQSLARLWPQGTASVPLVE